MKYNRSSVGNSRRSILRPHFVCRLLETAAFWIISLSIGSGEYGRLKQRKVSSKGLFFPTIASSIIDLIAAPPNHPSITVLSDDKSHRKRLFSPNKLGAAILEHCRSEKYQVRVCSSLPLFQVQLINRSRLDEIHSSWSLRLSSTQNGCIFTPFPSTGSENCG